MDDAECPPFYAKSTGIEGRITRWQDIEYHAPCLYLLHSRIAPVGRAARRRTATTSAPSTPRSRYAITPSTEATIYDFWAGLPGLRPRRRRRSPRSCGDFNRTVVMQDVVALNMLQRTLATEPDGYQELSINIDTGGLAARRILARLAEEGDKPTERVR